MAEPLGFAFGAGFVGGAIGFGIGYFTAIKRLETKYDKIAQDEIDEARDYYRAAKAATEARLKQPIEEVVEYLGYKKTEDTISTIDEHKQPVKYHQMPEPAEEATQTVFEQHPPSDHEWNLPAELMARKQNPGVPFVIHLDEFGDDLFVRPPGDAIEADRSVGRLLGEVVDVVRLRGRKHGVPQRRTRRGEKCRA